MKTAEGRGSFWDLLTTFFYRIKRVEHFQISPTQPSWWAEYLILYYEIRVPLISGQRQLVRSAFGFSEKRSFRRELERLRKTGVQIETRNLTLKEFAEVAKYHPILKKDVWVREELPKLLAVESINDTR